MTDIALREIQNGLHTVEELTDDFDKPLYKITSKKMKQYFTVAKTIDGYSFYEVRVSKGSLPQKLSGKFSSSQKAISEVIKYIDSIRESRATRRDNTYEENH